MTMTEKELKDAIFREINSLTLKGVGVKTTECGARLAARCGVISSDWTVCEMVRELIEAGRLVALTERWHDYCWLCPAELVQNQLNSNDTLILADRIWGLR